MNEQFMLLIIIKVDVVVYQSYFVKRCTLTCIEFEPWGDWIVLWKQSLNLIAFANGIPQSFDGNNQFDCVKN
jgi:hypothetical protein